ncbi:MAG: diadenylate cyclase CdaA [Chloroherpetonaceae bacterium]|nr:diadenylate cyclase CdaA [Chthonomonadaceae bacterium]MDW8207151.1 diadenylate cyclase CdaA [Chloroherpetonaceae bacterium]
MAIQSAWNLVRSSGFWLGLLDILVVSYLVYRLLLLARGSRALQILGGLGTLLLALFVSDRLHLYTLNWLLRQIVPLGPVAIVILFYPELRHALEEFGPRFWQRGLSLLNREDLSEMLEAVVNAVSVLSARRIGALIVFERQTGLDEVIATGIPLDAAVSAELLETIFYKGTPLHDGAVIIRNGRIVAAACILPLTDRPRIEAAVHTRHKAALGMSENSDAIVVVVSEETGTVSLAIEGKLLRGFRENTLRERLTALLQSTEKR